MRDVAMATLLGLAAFGLPAAAFAQAPQQSLGAQSVTTQSPTLVVPPAGATTAVRPSARNNTAAPVPSARVLGVPVTADAPVSPSYDGTAYKTLGGQAETDQDAISGQTMQPLDSAQPK